MKIFLVVCEASLNLEEYSWVKSKCYIVVPNFIYKIVIVLIVKPYFYLNKKEVSLIYNTFLRALLLCLNAISKPM